MKRQEFSALIKRTMEDRKATITCLWGWIEEREGMVGLWHHNPKLSIDAHQQWRENCENVQGFRVGNHVAAPATLAEMAGGAS